METLRSSPKQALDHDFEEACEQNLPELQDAKLFHDDAPQSFPQSWGYRHDSQGHRPRMLHEADSQSGCKTHPWSRCEPHCWGGCEPHSRGDCEPHSWGDLELHEWGNCYWGGYEPH